MIKRHSQEDLGTQGLFRKIQCGTELSKEVSWARKQEGCWGLAPGCQDAVDSVLQV
jgi:hypothetical protein